MKRFWLVLLSLGLVMAFSASAFAVDVKVSGTFDIGGMYMNKTSIVDGSSQPSTAFYWQRLRMKTDFIVSPGLSFVTRADIMSRVWGGTRSTNSTNEPVQGSALFARPNSAYEAQNIVFDHAYIQYTSPIGLFIVGYARDNVWGTVFGDTEIAAPQIRYITQAGPVNLMAFIAKYNDNSRQAYNGAIYGTQSDVDFDAYVLAAWYTGKQVQGGLIAKQLRSAQTRPAAAGAFKTTGTLLAPYAKMQFGPVAIQTEINYAFGKTAEFDSGTGDIKLENLAAWIDAVGTFGPVYVGGSIAYVSGDDPDTTDKREGGLLSGGADWNPCLIMWNYDRSYRAGALAGNIGGGVTTAQTSPMTNAFFYQLRAGVKPNDKLDIGASISMATADKSPAANWVSKDYGYEIDVTGTYKITNNLSYMLGLGYLMAGDYYKATNASNQITNNYLVINKLTLTF